MAGTNQPQIGILIYLEFSIMLVFTKRLTLAGFMLTFCTVFSLANTVGGLTFCLGLASPIELVLFMFSPSKEPSQVGVAYLHYNIANVFANKLQM